jgi:hypothetical protein
MTEPTGTDSAWARIVDRVHNLDAHAHVVTDAADIAMDAYLLGVERGAQRMQQRYLDVVMEAAEGLGRTVYRTGPDGDQLIGVMDTAELGKLVVDALNVGAATGTPGTGECCVSCGRPVGWRHAHECPSAAFESGVRPRPVAQPQRPLSHDIARNAEPNQETHTP